MNVVTKWPPNDRVDNKADHFSPPRAPTDPISSPTQLSGKDRTIKPRKKKIFKPKEEPRTVFENAEAKEGQKPAQCKTKKKNMLKWKIKSMYVSFRDNEDRCSGPVAGEDAVETSADSVTGTIEESKATSSRLAMEKEILPASKKQEEEKTEKDGQEEKKKETDPKAAKPAKKNMGELKKQGQGGSPEKDDAKKKELDEKKKSEGTAKKIELIKKEEAEQMKKEEAEQVKKEEAEQVKKKEAEQIKKKEAEQMKKKEAEQIKKKEAEQVEKKEDPKKKAENANKKEVPAKKPAEDAAKKEGNGKAWHSFFHRFINIFRWR